MEKRKLLIGLILFLVITNLVTIITVWKHLHSTQETVVSAQAVTDHDSTQAVPDYQRTRFFTSALNLDSIQQQSFRSIHRGYMQDARVISLNLNALRDSLLEEMNQDHPDTIRLDRLSEEIGAQHSELKKLTIQYYLGLKAICNPEQQTKLYEIIRTIIKPDGEVQLPKGQGGPGNRRGAGRGPWWQNN